MAFYRIVLTATLLFIALPRAYAQNSSGFSPKEARYLWPTDASSYLSSTFGETRSAHFHSALDLKTWGRRGYDVFATRDGILHRIAIGPTGYGKVVYLKHEDGSYSVYAHLLRFEKQIQRLADSLRFRDYSFEIDTVLDSLNIQIKQGEVIGLSGASGIGPPHLHFELRTPDQKPFNPLLTNLAIRDHRPPQFSGISVEPLSIRSLIEGSHRIYTRRSWNKNGAYTFGTIDIEGPVGIGVNVFDQADKVYNAYAVYELIMLVDGKRRFHSKVDSFSYQETHQLFVDRVYPLLQQTGAGYQRLYVADGNTLPFYEPLSKNGKLHLSPGRHQITIIAKDFYGNTSRAHLTLRVHSATKSPYRLVNSKKDRDSQGFDMESWIWFNDWVNLPIEQAGRLTIAPLEAEDHSLTIKNISRRNNVSVDLTSSRDVFFRSSVKKHFIARRVDPHSFAIVPSTTGGSFATFNAGTFYDTLSVGLITDQVKPDSVMIRIMPASQPVQNPFLLAVKLDSAQMSLQNVSLYAFNKRNYKLSYLPSSLRQSYLTAKPEALGTYYMLQDTTAPEIKSPKIIQRPDGQWLARVTVTDERSGINFKRSEFYVNGVRGIAEYEPEDDRLVYYHPDFKPESSNTFRIIVYDQEGHRKERTFEIDF